MIPTLREGCQWAAAGRLDGSVECAEGGALERGKRFQSGHLREVAAGDGFGVGDEFAPAAGDHVKGRRWRRPGNAADDHAAVRLVLYQAFAFEAAEGLAHGRLGHAPARGDLLLAQVLARGDAAGHDSVLQRLVDDIGLCAVSRLPESHGGRIARGECPTLALWYPTCMRQKTSVYLDPEHVTKLKRISHRTRRPPAAIIREAIDALPEPAEDDYAVIASFESEDARLSEVPKRELLRGFGEQ